MLRSSRSGIVPSVLACVLALSGPISAQAPNGWIQDGGWLLLGPLGNPGGCDPAGSTLLNWIAPSDVATILPAADDTMDIEFGSAASSSWDGIGDVPAWLSLADHGIQGGDVVDLQAIALTLGTAQGETIPVGNVLAVCVSYATYTGASPLPVRVCTASDDSIQVWVNDSRVQDAHGCRGVDADCSEVAEAVLVPGKNAIKVLVWQGDGGWGFRLRLIRSDGRVITDGDPEVTFGLSPSGTVSLPSTSTARTAGSDVLACSVGGDVVVGLKGSGDDPGNVRLVEQVEGPFEVFDVSNGGTFTPPAPIARNPVGIFEDARDVGIGVCTEGSTVDNGDGSYTVTGGGIDVWTQGDEFQFAYREATGDFVMTAHVAERVWVPGTRWGKVGIMARQDLSSASRYAMIQTHGEDLQDADRLAARPTHLGNDNLEVTSLAEGEHRDWMRLSRIGTLFRGEMSLDGIGWESIGEVNLGASTPRTMLLGLAVNGHDYASGGCEQAAITFDAVEIEGGNDVPDPPGPLGGEIVWNLTRAEIDAGVSYKIRGDGLARFSGHDGVHATTGDRTASVTSTGGPRGIFTASHDIGGPCIRGDTTFDDRTGAYAVTGSGIDIWTNGDQFQFAYQEVEGDFILQAHVAERSWAAGSRWGKVGIMARQDCTPLSRYAMMQTHGEDPQDQDRFAGRPTYGGADNFEATNLLAGEHRDWMRIARIGNTFTGYFSLDGLTWQQVHSMDWGTLGPGKVLAGLAVNAHSEAQGGCIPATIVFDEVTLRRPEYTVSRSLEGGSCPTTSDAAIVRLTGNGDPGPNLAVSETVRGPFAVSGITGGGTFAPFPDPSPLQPVGMFEDSRDIGAPCIAGSTVDNDLNSYTVTGGGLDIWTEGDQFQFAYRRVTGDFDMTARVSQRNWVPGSRWGKVGIMARETLSDRARYAMVQTHGEDPQDQDRFAGRTTPESNDNFEATPLLAGEHRDWMRLERVGNTFTGYMSEDGSTWQAFHSMSWGSSAPATVLLGLAVNGHFGDDGGCSAAAITFEEVEILGGDGPHEPLRSRGGTITWNAPRTTMSGGVRYTLNGEGIAQLSGVADGLVIAGQVSATVTRVKAGVGVFDAALDVGGTCSPGDTAFDPGDGSYTVVGSGTDIWQGGDRFQFAYKKMTGDFSMVSHVRDRGFVPGSRWGKVGIMAREDCSTRSRYAMMQTHGEDLQDGDRFAGRPTPGGADNFEAGILPGGEHRDWLRLDREGNLFTGYTSVDGTDWQVAASMTWTDPAPEEILLGLAVCGHDDASAGCESATIVFDEVEITIPGEKPLFRRGDSNADGTLNITDGIYVLNYLFLGGPTPTCTEAADANDDGGVNITDGIYVLNFLFLGGPPPPAPGPGQCGMDPEDSRGDLGCESYPAC